MASTASTPDWGLLPDTIQQRLRTLEWDNRKNLRDRLSGARTVTMKVSLKPPTGKQALADLDHFNHFINQWNQSPWQCFVSYESRKYRQIGRRKIPVKFELSSFEQLVQVLGRSARNYTERWQTVMQPLLHHNAGLYPVLIQHLQWLEENNELQATRLVQVLQQLHAGMGEDCYLRALPLQGIDTKFVETHEALLIDILDFIHNGEVSGAGGIRQWLDCRNNPGNWVLVRPLCQQTRNALGGLHILQIDTETLQQKELSAEHILMVENDQSGLCLPEVKNTIAVISGGNNLSWLDNNQWLKQHHTLYWGDIDSWGFGFLDNARRKQPHIESIMMDVKTVNQFSAQMVEEAQSRWLPLSHLTTAEQQLYIDLSRGQYPGNRLEQEKLSQDYIIDSLRRF